MSVNGFSVERSSAPTGSDGNVCSVSDQSNRIAVLTDSDPDTSLEPRLVPTIEKTAPRQRRSRVSKDTDGLRLRAAACWPELRNGSLSLLDQAIVSATSFATSVIIGRVCSKEQLGDYYLALTIVYLAKAVQDTVISAPYAIYCHGQHGESRAYYSGSTLLHYVGLSLACGLVLAGMVGLLSLGIGPIELLPALWVLLVTLPFIQLREVIRRIAIAQLRLRTAITIDLLVGSLQIGALVALAYRDRLTIPWAYVVMGTACLIASCAWYQVARRSLRFDWSRAVADWRSNWKFARWALASHAVGFATLYVTPWIVTALRDIGEAGVLAACVSVVGLASMFMTGLSAFLTPRAALAFEAHGAGELRRVLRTATTVYVAALGSFAVSVFASGDRFLVLAFGGKYAGNGAVLGVLALSTLALSIGLTAGIGLWAIDQPRANLVADVCTLVVTLTLVIALLPLLGLLGAALGDLAGKSTGAIVRHATLRQLLATIPPRMATAGV